MKKWFSRKHIANGLMMFLVGVAFIVVWLVLSRLTAIRAQLSLIMGTAAPIIYGLVLAYLLIPLMHWYERTLFTGLSRRLTAGNPKRFAGVRRMLSIAATMITTLLFLYGFFRMVVPSLYESIRLLIVNMRFYIYEGQKLIMRLFNEQPELESIILNIWTGFAGYVDKLLNGETLQKIGNLAVILSSGAISAVKLFLNLIIGLIVSVYVMSEKETFAAQAKKIVYSIFDIKTGNRIVKNAYDANRIFSGFLIGKVIDSSIIGILCFILMILFRIDSYRALICVIIGITNMIPFFGPLIGAIPSAFLLLIIDPFMSLRFVIMILLLQQFDGNVLGPKILGQYTGLSSFWVICSITIAGGLFGFVGMLFGVPLFAVLYSFIGKSVSGSLKRKNLVSDTSEFKRILYLDEETGAPVYRDAEPDAADDPATEGQMEIREEDDKTE